MRGADGENKLVPVGGNQIESSSRSKFLPRDERDHRYLPGSPLGAGTFMVPRKSFGVNMSVAGVRRRAAEREKVKESVLQ